MKIMTKIIWENRSGNNTSWFHPKITDTASGQLLMTLQGIGGSDYYQPVHESISDDQGESWSTPKPIPGFGHADVGYGLTEGICDVVPDFHPPTRTVLAIGHNVYYRNNGFFDSHNNPAEIPLQRFPVYAIRNPEGQWTVTRKKLVIPDFNDTSSYTCGCSQKVFIGNQLYLPMTFGFKGRKDRLSTSFLCEYDGNEITIKRRGSTLELPMGRGLMEPQLFMFNDRFLMTLRTEAGHGFHTVSPDGLNWQPMQAWSFEDGELLHMINNQQHWLQQDGKLYLIYNRKLPYNQHIVRWRSPLLIAEVDPEKMVLLRATEQVVFPIMPEDTNAEFKAALYGNFHPYRLSDKVSLVSVGEERSHDSYKSNTLIARLIDE